MPFEPRWLQRFCKQLQVLAAEHRELNKMLDKPKTKTTKAAIETLKAQLEGKSPTQVAISPPNFQTAKVKIVGDAPYVMNRMSSANRQKMVAKQESGERAKKGQKRDPKNFDAVYKGAMHLSTDNWYGIPASAFRNAMISACRTVGFAMTRAKLCVFVEHDGIDKEDGQPLIKLVGAPTRKDMPVKLADGSTDILPRPFFMKWQAVVTLKWDADQFSASDVINLLARAGVQVGIGAGRPDSKESCGMGWGTFRVEA